MAQSIDPIFLLAPTSTDDRIQKIAQLARGYVYYVSLKGVTGADSIDIDDVVRQLSRIRRYLNTPVGVGFGIRSPESARRIAEHADAVVIGSKLIQTMEAAMQADNNPEYAIYVSARCLSTVQQVLVKSYGDTSLQDFKGQDTSMSWIQRILPPRMERTAGNERVPEGLWVKCPACEAVLYKEDLQATQNVCAKRDHNKRLTAREPTNCLL